jgi:hypothetical protein
MTSRPILQSAMRAVSKLGNVVVFKINIADTLVSRLFFLDQNMIRGVWR